MTGAPAFSVICPVYNRSAAFVPTLMSVLGQSREDWELLVLSDGSDDDTTAVARSVAGTDRRVRVFDLPRSGHPSGPRRTGLAAACGRYIAYLDHDDVWRPDHLARLGALLDGGADLAVTGYRAVDEAGVQTRASGWWDMCWHPELQALDPLFEPSRFAHRQGLAEAAGGWRVTYGLEDWDLLWRLSRTGLRVRTTTERTVSVFESTGTRRHALRPRHTVPLWVTDRPRAAQRLRLALDAPSGRSAMASAAREDGARRIERLAASPGFVRPDASAEVPGPRDARTTDGGRGARLLVVPHRGAYALALPLFCSSQEHALEIGGLLPLHAEAQLGVVRELAAEAEHGARQGAVG